MIEESRMFWEVTYSTRLIQSADLGKKSYHNGSQTMILFATM